MNNKANVQYVLQMIDRRLAIFNNESLLDEKIYRVSPKSACMLLKYLLLKFEWPSTNI